MDRQKIVNEIESLLEDNPNGDRDEILTYVKMLKKFSTPIGSSMWDIRVEYLLNKNGMNQKPFTSYRTVIVNKIADIVHYGNPSYRDRDRDFNTLMELIDILRKSGEPLGTKTNEEYLIDQTIKWLKGEY